VDWEAETADEHPLASGMMLAGPLGCFSFDLADERDFRVKARVARAITDGERLKAASFRRIPSPCQEEQLSTRSPLNGFFRMLRK
jgi:hypothetical protein